MSPDEKIAYVQKQTLLALEKYERTASDHIDWMLT